MLLQYKYHSIYDEQMLFWRGIFEEIVSFNEFCKIILDIFRNVRCYTNAASIKFEELLKFLAYARAFTKYHLYCTSTFSHIMLYLSIIARKILFYLTSVQISLYCVMAV